MTKQLDFNLELFNVSSEISMAVDTTDKKAVFEDVTFNNEVEAYNKFTDFLTSLVPGSAKEVKEFITTATSDIVETIRYATSPEELEDSAFYNVPIKKVKNGYIVNFSLLIDEAVLLTAPKLKSIDGKTYHVYENDDLENFLKSVLTHEILLNLQGDRIIKVSEVLEACKNYNFDVDDISDMLEVADGLFAYPEEDIDGYIVDVENFEGKLINDTLTHCQVTNCYYWRNENNKLQIEAIDFKNDPNQHKRHVEAGHHVIYDTMYLIAPYFKTYFGEL